MKMKPHLPIICTLCLVSARAHAESEYEVITYGINIYQGRCGGSNLTYPTSDAEIVADAFAETIGDPDSHTFTNSNVLARDFTDPEKHPAWGVDDLEDSGADSADYFFHSGHGAHECHGDSSSNFWVTVGAMADSYCEAYSENNMKFGDDIRAALFATCQSAQRCVFTDGGYWSMERPGLSVVNGFHGNSWDNADNNWRYYLYIHNSQTSGLGDNWLDYMHQYYVFQDDQCPASVVFGYNSGDTDYWYSNVGFAENPSYQTHYSSTYYYICSCDPNDGPGLPGC